MDGLVFVSLIFGMAFGVPAYLMWWGARQQDKRDREKLARRGVK